MKKEDFPIYKFIKFNDYYFCIKTIFIFYVLAKFINLFNEKIIILMIINLLLLYGPIEKKYSFFVFKGMMVPIQIFEGVLGILSCLIPKYEE